VVDAPLRDGAAMTPTARRGSIAADRQSAAMSRPRDGSSSASKNRCDHRRDGVEEAPSLRLERPIKAPRAERGPGAGC
jgi:hypothetical protein